jgi:hypothetical protein
MSLRTAVLSACWVYVGHTPNDRADPQASDDGCSICQTRTTCKR